MEQQIADFLGQLGWLRLDLLGRLLLAALLGGLVGLEREFSGKPAGLRTNLLICVGAALLGDVSIHYATLAYDGGHIRADPTRIASQIVSGIGFLGAGTIIQARGSVIGLTTAATLWVVAAIGIAVGGGAYVAAVGTTVLVLVALVPLGWAEGWVKRRHTVRSVRVVVQMSEGAADRTVAHFRDRDLDAAVEKIDRDPEDDVLVIFLKVKGPRRAVEEAGHSLVNDEGVRSLAVHDLG